MKLTLFVSASLALGAVCAPVNAQTTAGGQTTTPASQTESFAIEEVVVTAQRRPEKLQDVPVSVTAVGGDALKARAINDPTQLTLAAPSLQLGKENSFAIRGIGTLAFATTLDSSVATAIDEVNIGRPLAGGNGFLDVAQVEVLNGPQGLLFGKNASAGLVNITTTRPKIGIYSVSADVEADARPRDSNGVLARGTVNIPVSANSALRLSGLYNYQDPLNETVLSPNVRYDDQVRQWGVRGKYLVEVSDQFTVYAIADYNKQSGVSGYADATYRSLGAGSTNAPYLPNGGADAGPENFVYVSSAPAYRDLKNGGAQINLSYVAGNGVELTNITAWRFFDYDQQSDGDGTLGDGLNTNRSASKYDQYSNEFRVALPAGERLTGQAGLFAFHSKVDGLTDRAGSNYLPGFLLPQFPFCVGATVAAGGPPNCSVSNAYFLGTDKLYTTETTSYAAFGQFTYQLMDQLKLIAGARLTHDKIDIKLTQNQRNYFVAFGARGVFDQSYDNTNLSWRTGLQYNPSQRVMVYGTFARGFKGPGFNDTAPAANADLKILPERSDSFEAGFKSTLWDRRLTLNVSAFHNKLSNYQAQGFDTALRTFVVRNAASVTNKGVEMNAVMRPVAHLTFNASATLLSSKFNEFEGAQCYPGQATPSCAVDGTFNAAGLRTPSSPKFSGTLGAAYDKPLSDTLSLVADVNLYHRSTINYALNNAPGASVGAVDILGGSIGVRGDRWSAALFCKNCTNKVMPNYIDLDAGDSTAGIASYTQQFGYNSVRTVGIRLGADF